MALNPNTITSNANHTNVKKFQGFSVVAGEAAAINFRRGTSEGRLVFPLAVGAGEVAAITFVEEIPTPEGVYVEVESGTIASGVLFAS